MTTSKSTAPAISGTTETLAPRAPTHHEVEDIRSANVTSLQTELWPTDLASCDRPEHADPLTHRIDSCAGDLARRAGCPDRTALGQGVASRRLLVVGFDCKTTNQNNHSVPQWHLRRELQPARRSAVK